MVSVGEERVIHLCQALKLNGYYCGNKGYTTRHIEENQYHKAGEIHLCWHHKDWHPDTHKGKSYRRRQLSNRDKSKKDKLRKRLAERCIFPNKMGEVCQSPVTKRDENQQPLCYYHWKQLDEANPEVRAHLRQRIVEAELFRATGKPLSDEEDIKAGKRKLVKTMPTMEEQLAQIEAKAQEHKDTIQPSPSEYGIQFAVKKPRGKTLGKAHFLGIDIEHYTPDFKYDYLYLLFNQIRRAEAVVMVLHEQLMRIEEEEELLKVTETKGTMMGPEGTPVAFDNTTTRHVTPIETKLTLIDKLTKQEQHLAKLLKQLEELPLTCLTVFRKMGVKWDRNAAQMVIAAIEEEKMKTIEGYTTVDLKSLPSTMDEVNSLTKQTQLNAPMSIEQVQTQKPLKADW